MSSTGTILTDPQNGMLTDWAQPPVGEKATGQVTSIFSKEGAIGKHLNSMLPLR